MSQVLLQPINLFKKSVLGFDAGADPGFPIGVWTHFGGHGPPMRLLFGENKRIGSHRGACARKFCV